MPSSKNNKRIVQIPAKTSRCCNSPILDTFEGKKKILICSSCKRIALRNTYPRIMNSELVEKYIKSTESIFIDAKTKALWKYLTQGLEAPIFLGMYFLRAIDNEWDFNNASQIVQDLLQKHGYVTSDSTRNLIPVYLGHHKNDAMPGIVMFPLRDPWQLITDNLNHSYGYFTENNLTR